MKPAWSDQAVVSEALALVSPAAGAFEGRWTMSALKRIDADLHEALVDQQRMFNAAIVTGSKHDVREHAEAMVRGYAAAVRCMEASGADDDAYMVGLDARTGTRVAIGQTKHSIGRVQRVHGEQCVFMTPDEVAKLVAGSQMLASIKSVFPDAEVVDVFPNEVAKGDVA